MNPGSGGTAPSTYTTTIQQQRLIPTRFKRDFKALPTATPAGDTIIPNGRRQHDATRPRDPHHRRPRTDHRRKSRDPGEPAPQAPDRRGAGTPPHCRPARTGNSAAHAGHDRGIRPSRRRPHRHPPNDGRKLRGGCHRPRRHEAGHPRPQGRASPAGNKDKPGWKKPTRKRQPPYRGWRAARTTSTASYWNKPPPGAWCHASVNSSASPAPAS